MTTIRIAGTNPEALTDGPGKRFSVYLQGCSIHCPGCQVPHLWDPDGGYKVNARKLAHEALASGLPVSILGGEPFDQAGALHDLLFWLRKGRLDKCLDDPMFIIVYTGYTFETLMARAEAELRTQLFDTAGVLMMANVLVDGPFIQDRDHDRLQYRGSANQRVIALPPTFAARRADPGSAPVLLDWDTPELIITPDGDVLAAEGLANEFAALGAGEPARRCGAVKRAPDASAGV
ncbi:MAG: radical SAM protein [Anaerolineae bacterium]|nr:radical SAM protein [Anaerolineae bacterium]